MHLESTLTNPEGISRPNAKINEELREPIHRTRTSLKKLVNNLIYGWVGRSNLPLVRLTSQVESAYVLYDNATCQSVQL
jgi:hypothetical protein